MCIRDSDFCDLDELAEVAQGWGVDFRQLNRGGFSGSLRQLAVPEAQISRVRLQGVVHQRGVAPEGYFSFAVPLRRGMDLVWRHQRIEQNQVLVYQSSGEIECTSQRDFEVLILAVSKAALGGALDRAGHAVDHRLLSELEILPVSASLMDTLRHWISSNLPSALDEIGLAHNPSVLRNLEVEGSDLLARCLSASSSSPVRGRTTRRRRLVEEAVRLARDHARDVQTVAELSELSGASERTLRRAFSERFKVSPKAYLQAQKLIGVRRQLRAISSETLIIDVANEWGFWHMGQFAADYRRHFGELPSETVRGGQCVRDSDSSQALPRARKESRRSP